MDKLQRQLKENYRLMIENENNRLIAVDMDGVLTNFPKAFDEATINNDEFPPSNGMGPHEYEEEYGKDTFWKAIETAGEEFWSEMEWMPDGKILWNYVRQYNPTILSAPSRDPKCITGKIKWLKNNVRLPNYNLQTKAKNGWDGVSKIILNSQKHRYATGPDDILIDDTEKKIKAWREAGGTAIHHKNAEDTIKQLKELGL